MGADVHGYSLAPPSDPNLFEALDLESLISSTFGDVRDIDHLAQAFDSARPDIVFHFAAQSLVRRSFEDPEETYSTNVVGTSTVLKTVLGQASTKVVLVATSDKCYRNDNSGRAFKEADPLGGSDHYSASKACTEHVVEAYRKAQRNESPAIASLRAGNVVGGGDWASDRLIPDLMRSWDRKPASIRYPDSTRPWQHVLDCLNGYLMLAEAMWIDPRKAGPWNFGPQDPSPLSVREIAEMTVKLTEGRTSFSIDPDEHLPEATALVLDSGKARAGIGWSPELSIEESVAWAIKWYAAVNDGVSATQMSTQQIEAFMGRANG